MRLRTVLVITALCVALAGCGGGGQASSHGKLQVVAAENFWGSIASQLGGSKVSVQSIIVNPNTDPHSYEPTASDARTMAGAQLAIVNGIGYDTWASHLLAANPVSGRTTLDVGNLLGLVDGDNPHQWYSPTSVQKVIGAIVADYDKLEPADKAYFASQEHRFETVSLATYNRLRAEIRRRFAGVPVGYSESIFQPLGQSLGLKLLTPYSFAKAIAEGTEISAQDKETVDAQAQKRLIKVWVYNSQNATPGHPEHQHDLPLQAHPDRDRHRDTFTRERQLRAVAGGRAAGTDHGAARGDRKVEDMPAIELADVTVARGGRVVWSGANVDVEPGEFVAVLGPNAAGKSTLIELLLGLLQPSAGTVSVLGGASGHQWQRDRLRATAARVRRDDADPRHRHRPSRPRRNALRPAAALARRRSRAGAGGD